VALIVVPVSTMCWKMREPWLETNHFWVSQAWRWASPTVTPGTARMAAVARISRSPFSARETSLGCSCHPDVHSASVTGTSAISMGGPGTRADALAISAASYPAWRAVASEGSVTEKNPHEEPMRARTPTPPDSLWRRPSSSPLRALRASLLFSPNRASA
jgi:hypothetical protein